MMTFGSLYWKIPTTVQQKQLTNDASVNGNGIDVAFLVFMTFVMALNGDANIATVNATPAGPTTDCATSMADLYGPITGNSLMTATVAAMIDRTVTRCCRTDPGNVGDDGGE